MSESTKNYDRGDKFEFDRSIPSFEEYVLVDQSRVYIEQFYIGQEGHWVLQEYDNPNDTLKLVKIDFEMPLKDMYRRVTFEESQSPR